MLVRISGFFFCLVVMMVFLTLYLGLFLDEPSLSTSMDSEKS